VCTHPDLAPDATTGPRVPSRGRPCPHCRDGYPTRRIRHAKQRREQVLAARLAAVEKRLVGKMYRLTPDGRRRLGARLHLDAADLTEQTWRDDWSTARAWCGSSGSTGEHRGNRMFKLDPDTGLLSITIPKPVAEAHGLGPVRQWAAGYILTLAAPVSFTLHGIELADRLGENFGVRFDLEPRYTAGKITRAYLRASWTREHLPPLPTLETAREAGMLGVDLNADHFAAARIDASGNPLRAPRSIPLVQAGPASLRDARLREAITALLDLAEETGAGTTVVEDLNFTDPTARERGHGRRMRASGRRCRGSRRRRSVPGWRRWLPAAASRWSASTRGTRSKPEVKPGRPTWAAADPPRLPPRRPGGRLPPQMS
jgi:hypothetical protein